MAQRWEFHVKHSDIRVQTLAELCAQAHVEVPVEVFPPLVAYLAEVLRANKSVNLTRITDPSQATRLHVLDSLCALPEVTGAPAGRVCDIGSGAGFPGVPLALAAARKCTLLDSVGKKGDVASRILKDLGLDGSISVSKERAEQHARNHPGKYSVVTARAVAPLASLVELAAPLLSRGGRLVALKGSPCQSELDAGLAAAAVVGMEFRTRREFILPGGYERRCVIVYVNARQSRVPLPRREGLAQHAPLG